MDCAHGKQARCYSGIPDWVLIFALNAALRGAGDTRTPFIIMLVVDGLNIVFSLFLVKVCGMFVEGLALGMIGGMAAAATVLLGILMARTIKLRREMAGRTLDNFCAEQGNTYAPPLYLDTKSMKIDWSMMYRILSIGVPQAIEVGGIWLIQIFVLRIISSLGDAAVGAHNIAIRIESLSFLPGFAIGMAGATLVGQYLGARSARLALETTRKCVRYSVLFMGCMGVVFALWPDIFVDIFAAGSPELSATTRPVVQAFLIIEPFYAAMLICKMCLRGAGDTRRVMWVSYGGMGFFHVLCLLVWYWLWPETLSLVGIWMLIACDMLVEYLILRKMLFGLRWVRRKV